MDIFKVLSRGIKPTQSKRSAQAAASTTTNTASAGSTSAKPAAATTTVLPSAGARPNPQLYHDEIPGASQRGKKRKRKGSKKTDDDAVPENEDGDVSDGDVDFFAPKEEQKDSQTNRVVDEDEVQQKKRKPKLLDREECRAVLRSHRLKFTVLSGSGVGGEEDEPARKKVKGKKKGDKREEDDDKKGKKEKLQVYPQPLRAFGELRYTYDLHTTVSDNIVRQGFRVPTEVQMGSLPLLLRPGMALGDAEVNVERGVDFLGIAPTGSGKTISFLIPAIDGILKRRREGDEEHVMEAVVVAPTRELASQIVNEGRKLAIGTGVRVVLMKRSLRLAAEDLAKGEEHEQEDNEDEESGESEAEESEGSEDEHDQGAKPVAKVDILVTTPKILLNFLSGEKAPGKKVTVRKAMPSVRSLILDEADVLLDPLFRKQTMAIWRACTNPDLNLTCWSATMASNIESLVAKELEKRSKRVGVTRPLIRLVVGLKDTAVPNITHKLTYTATEQGKLLALRQLLHPVSSADSGPPLRPPFLVFTQTIERAQALHDELQYDIPLEAGGSARVAVLHSSLGDSARSKIMARFRAGEVWVLITTDVLARGVDFAGVNGVVNYDVPGSAAAYVHRAGRTGRAGREGGVAVTFYTKDDIPFVKSVANVIAASEKQASKTGTEGATVQKWLLDALPKVAKEDKRKLKVRGVESRRQGGKASITTKSTWERRRENNRLGAIEASKRRKRMAAQSAVGDAERDGDGEGGEAEEWSGLED
ncbi:P-loop containing nucleoside triphosphate hydrolase protein [Echria macrotheca]|uniref:ATP-dependent RNA helicase ROK1 n=1 Tax=Echria macrotheca TaxID=438768 RepID=A0AAJ0B6Q5_9PEZI|nr:P-loop containing nucleoside triphosphate hydrolase protein [Echria macrotheca]